GAPQYQEVSFAGRKVFGLGLQGDSSVSGSARKECGPDKGCVLVVEHEKEFGPPETQLWSLRCNCITMMQAAESGQRLNLAGIPANCCWPTCWCSQKPE